MADDEIEVKGKMEWDLKDSFINPSQFHSAVPYSREISSSITTSRTQVEVVSTSMQETSDTKSEIKRTSEKIGPISIEPGESVYVFEKRVKFPTVSWDTGELQVWPSADIPPINEEVVMKTPVHVRPVRRYLKDIKVCTYGGMTYSKNFMPYKEGSSGESKNVQKEDWGNINRGFGDRHVFLETSWTEDLSKGADKIEVVVCGGVPGWTKDRGQEDMAKGAGGDYRFLDIWHCKAVKEKIVDVVLWGGKLHRVPDGWSGMTEDLKKGRGGRYVYIVWKKVPE